MRDLAPGNISSRPAFFVQDKGSVLFSADDGAGGRELWRARISELRDCTPPRIFCGDFFPVTASGPEGAVVDHLPVSTRDAGPEPTLRYSKPPGSLFPIGTTPVTVTATDVGGNNVSCTLEVTVLPPEAPGAPAR